jgi:hypothetical protein
MPVSVNFGSTWTRRRGKAAMSDPTLSTLSLLGESSIGPASKKDVFRRMQSDAFDEDGDLRSSLAALGHDGLRERQDVLSWPELRRDVLLRSLVGRPEAELLAQLIAIGTQTGRTAAGPTRTTIVPNASW